MGLFSLIFHRYRIVRDAPVFTGLNRIQIHRIASRAEILYVHKGAVIYHQGAPADGFYCLVSGRVQAYCCDDQGRKHAVEFFRRGMYFGIGSLLTGSAHSMTFEAVNDSVLLFLPKNFFLTIVKIVPHLGMEFSRSLSRRLQQRSLKGKKASLSRIISVYSPVKQAGSSTYAFHLACQIAHQAGADVILVQIASALSSSSQAHGVSDGAQAAPRWKERGRHLDEIIGQEDVIRSLAVSTGVGIDLLNACFYPDDALLVSRMSEFVTALAVDYDYVVVDLPNDMDDVVLKTLTQSDDVHLIAHDDHDELLMLSNVINALEEALKENFDPRRVRVLLKSRPGTPDLDFESVRDILDYDIYARLPYVTDDQLSEARDLGSAWVSFPAEGASFLMEVVKIAREVSGVRIGLVLGGGAALGIAHIGVLKVLEREKIPVDIIAGSSMGALLAALWVASYDAGCLVDIAQQFRNQRAMFKLFDPVLPVSGIIGGRLIKRWLYRFLGDKHFYDTRIPLRIVAYDLKHRQELVYDSGRLVDAVRKTISIPGIFEPVTEDGRVIIDGGVLNPVPTDILRQLGVDRIIAVNVLQSPEEVVRGQKIRQASRPVRKDVVFLRTPLRFLKGCFTRKTPRPMISDIMVQTLLASEFELSRRSEREADVMIHPDLSDIQWYEFYRVDELIRRGEEAAEKALVKIKNLVIRK